MATRERPNLRSPDDPEIVRSVELRSATPLEYLERWICNNDVFGDRVALRSVVQWADGEVSFVISQPHYDGEPATDREIMSYFEQAGWTYLAKEKEHEIYFNYAFGVLAIDAFPRNCYIRDGHLQPIDVILCRPDEAMEEHLAIYPS